MNIIIAGAGDVGFHLAQLLSLENQDIILIDKSKDVLDYSSKHLDVKTIEGDSASIKVLEDAGADKANLLIAVTTSEKINLLTAILGKQLGVKKTIARVSSQEYLSEKQKDAFAKLGIDTLISPQELATNEIHRLVQQCSFTDIFEFEGGVMNLLGFSLDDLSPLVNLKISEIIEIAGDQRYKPIAILRGGNTIIPKGETILRRNDHLYFIVKKEFIKELTSVFGKKEVNVKNIMILGGTELAATTARKLENDYNVKLFEPNKDKCKALAESFKSALAVHANTSDVDLLDEEGLENMDVFIALTPNSETNIISSLTAKNRGVYKTIAQVENKEYTKISQNIGVDTLINKKLIAANNIFRYIRQGRVEAITSLHGVEAEIIEFVVHKDNQLTKKPINCLHFPEKALIGGVIRGNESFIPSGEFQLEVDDKVIVFAMPEAISKMEKMFR